MLNSDATLRFKMGEVVLSSLSGMNGVVYDHAYDGSPDRQIFYGVMWSDGSRSWESFHSLVSVSLATDKVL